MFDAAVNVTVRISELDFLSLQSSGKMSWLNAASLATKITILDRECDVSR
jgi:hypothetical protein